MTLPSFLRAQYDILATRWRERWPAEEPPPFPDGATDPNAVVNVNQRLLARLTGRPPIRIVTNAEPVVLAPARKAPSG